VEFLAFISGHATEEAEFLLLLGLRATLCLILALPAMSVQHKIDRCWCGRNSHDLFPNFVHQWKELDPKHGVGVTMDDLAGNDIAPKRLGRHERIEGEQQFIVFC